MRRSLLTFFVFVTTAAVTVALAGGIFWLIYTIPFFIFLLAIAMYFLPPKPKLQQPQHAKPTWWKPWR